MAGEQATDERAFLESTPSPDGLGRMADMLGGGRVTDVVRLLGGISASTHRFRLGGQTLVLKRDLPGKHLVEREWPGLVHARLGGAPTPEPIAVDLHGGWFGGPAMVVSHLPGEVRMRPGDPPDGWLRGLVVAMLQMHDTPVEGFVAPRSPRWQRWSPWQPDATMTAALAEVVDRLAATDQPPVFSHGDFHPGNALFDGDQVVGLVDLASCTLEPRSSDVAYCRKDLRVFPGGDLADRFLAIYEAEWGARLPDLALWDALHADSVVRWGHLWPPGFAEVGVTITVEHIEAAATAFVADALRRAGVSR